MLASLKGATNLQKGATKSTTVGATGTDPLAESRAAEENLCFQLVNGNSAGRGRQDIRKAAVAPVRFVLVRLGSFGFVGAYSPLSGFIQAVLEPERVTWK